MQCLLVILGQTIWKGSHEDKEFEKILFKGITRAFLVSVESTPEGPTVMRELRSWDFPTWGNWWQEDHRTSVFLLQHYTSLLQRSPLTSSVMPSIFPLFFSLWDEIWKSGGMSRPPILLHVINAILGHWTSTQFLEIYIICVKTKHTTGKEEIKHVFNYSYPQKSLSNNKVSGKETCTFQHVWSLIKQKKSIH